MEFSNVDVNLSKMRWEDEGGYVYVPEYKSPSDQLESAGSPGIDGSSGIDGPTSYLQAAGSEQSQPPQAAA